MQPSHPQTKFLNIKDKEMILKTSRNKNSQDISKGMRKVAFSSATLSAGRQWRDAFKVVRKKLLIVFYSQPNMNQSNVKAELKNSDSTALRWKMAI